MRKISKKILSILLVVAMTLSTSAMMFTVGAEESSSIKVGDTITLGTYLGEPIVWRCVAIDKNGPLMLSDKILCFKSFDAKGNYNNYYRNKEGTNNWKDSALRHWLNSNGTVNWSNRISVPSSNKVFNGYNPYSDEKGFLTGFTTQELSMVKSVTQKSYINAIDKERADGGRTAITHYDGSLSNLANVTSNLSNCYYQNVQDSFFLLGIEQLETVYKNMGIEYFKCQPTDAAVKNDTTGLTNTDTTYNWWLRIPATMGMSYENVKVVGPDGVYGGLSAFSVWNGSNYYSVGVRPAFYLDLDKYEESVKGKFLEGYSEADKYSFVNQTSEIPRDYYSAMFSSIKTNELLANDNGTGGQCYGMATTTALFLQDKPSPNKVEIADNKYATHISDMWNVNDASDSNNVREDSFISTYQIHLSDFIKYAHIYQYKASIQKEKNMNANEYDKLLNAVVSYINGGEPIIIGVRGNYEGQENCGHALLPVGIIETNDAYDIFVNDSNHPEAYAHLKLNKENGKITGWSYELLDWGNDKPNGKICYSTPCESNLISFYEAYLRHHPNDTSFLESSYKLISTNNNNSMVKDDRFIEILSENGTSTDNYLYWADESLETLTISAVDKETEFSYCDDYVGVSAVIPEGSKAECVVNDETFSNIIISDAKDNVVEISFDTATEDSQDITTITISGIATDNEVTATQTETGIKVTGIANGTITLKKNNDVLSTEKISCSDGNSEIEYDKTGTSSEVSAKYEEKHNDANNDGICDDCNKVLDASKSCYCACHTNIIVKFVLMIIDAIFRAFGSSFDCACGMSHR